MKVVLICASPRGKASRTLALAKKVLLGCERSGAQTEVVHLCKYRIGFCRHCELCHKKILQCPIRDNAMMLARKILDADGVIFATPNYINQVPRTPREGDETRHRTWERIALRVAASPKRAAGIVAAVLVVLALGCLLYSPRFSFTDDFLTSMPSSEGYALLEKHFPKGALAPTTVLIKAEEAPPEFVTGMITGVLDEAPGVAAAFPTGTAMDGRLLRFQVVFEGDPYSSETLDQVREVREVAREAAAQGGGTALVGGPTATQADTWAQSNRDTLVVAVVALVVVGAILMVLLRAVVAPLYLLLTNVLSYLAALGATIVITEKILGWEDISYRIPLYMFIFLVALGSDYNIFITTRIRSEAMLHGLRDGTVKALTATGGVLTSAGIILAGTFLILLSQPVKDLAEISIGVALGVLIDTFLVRTALVPGLTLWVGPKAGWPGPRWTKKAEAAQDRPHSAIVSDDPVGDEA